VVDMQRAFMTGLGAIPTQSECVKRSTA
jgi:hypothetical protein